MVFEICLICITSGFIVIVLLLIPVILRIIDTLSEVKHLAKRLNNLMDTEIEPLLAKSQKIQESVSKTAVNLEAISKGLAKASEVLLLKGVGSLTKTIALFELLQKGYGVVSKLFGDTHKKRKGGGEG